jgi:polyphosphate kinase 2 (PPK2 family)
MRAPLERKEYEQALRKLHVELVKLQLWVRHQGLKVVVVFEGRDAAGKGGIIKRITE